MSEAAAMGTSTQADFLAGKTRIRISDLQEAKRRKEKWAMLTSYDATSARIFDVARIPCLLIGDSAAQAVYGMKSTIPITMEELIPLARAVASSCERALVIVDMPFGSYQESPQVALRNAVRFMKEAQVHGVKLEGGAEYVEHVKLLIQAGIPVMAHIGFTPQSEHVLSGFKIQARDVEAQQKLINDALSLEAAGAFACVLEMVPAHVGQSITSRLRIPTVGIGAGPDTDAQILVWHDMAGFTPPRGTKASGYLGDGSGSAVTSSEAGSCQTSGSSATTTTTDGLQLNRVPKFVKKYANVSEILYKAVRDYADEVKRGTYPAPEHCYQ